MARANPKLVFSWQHRWVNDKEAKVILFVNGTETDSLAFRLPSYSKDNIHTFVTALVDNLNARARNPNRPISIFTVETRKSSWTLRAKNPNGEGTYNLWTFEAETVALNLCEELNNLYRAGCWTMNDYLADAKEGRTIPGAKAEEISFDRGYLVKPEGARWKVINNVTGVMVDSFSRMESARVECAKRNEQAGVSYFLTPTQNGFDVRNVQGLAIHWAPTKERGIQLVQGYIKADVKLTPTAQDPIVAPAGFAICAASERGNHLVVRTQRGTAGRTLCGKTRSGNGADLPGWGIHEKISVNSYDHKFGKCDDCWYVASQYPLGAPFYVEQGITTGVTSFYVCKLPSREAVHSYIDVDKAHAKARERNDQEFSRILHARKPLKEELPTANRFFVKKATYGDKHFVDGFYWQVWEVFNGANVYRNAFTKEEAARSYIAEREKLLNETLALKPRAEDGPWFVDDHGTARRPFRVVRYAGELGLQCYASFGVRSNAEASCRDLNQHWVENVKEVETAADEIEEAHYIPEGGDEDMTMYPYYYQIADDQKRWEVRVWVDSDKIQSCHYRYYDNSDQARRAADNKNEAWAAASPQDGMFPYYYHRISADNWEIRKWIDDRRATSTYFSAHPSALQAWRQVKWLNKKWEASNKDQVPEETAVPDRYYVKEDSVYASKWRVIRRNNDGTESFVDAFKEKGWADSCAQERNKTYAEERQRAEDAEKAINKAARFYVAYDPNREYASEYPWIVYEDSAEAEPRYVNSWRGQDVANKEAARQNTRWLEDRKKYGPYYIKYELALKERTLWPWSVYKWQEDANDVRVEGWKTKELAENHVKQANERWRSNQEKTIATTGQCSMAGPQDPKLITAEGPLATPAGAGLKIPNTNISFAYTCGGQEGYKCPYDDRCFDDDHHFVHTDTCQFQTQGRKGSTMNAMSRTRKRRKENVEGLVEAITDGIGHGYALIDTDINEVGNLAEMLFASDDGTGVMIVITADDISQNLLNDFLNEEKASEDRAKKVAEMFEGGEEAEE